MPPPSLDYEFCARTDVGRVRRNNEDAVAIDADARLTILADGMGGYNAGEVASAMAVQTLGNALRQRLPQSGEGAGAHAVRTAIEYGVEQANHAVYQAAQADPRYAGMGTTLVVGVFHRHRLVLGHIGDSRGYLLRAGTLRQITRDHTWLQEQMDNGLMSPSEAARSGMRSLLTRALGVDPQVRADINEFAVRPADLFLLCSDGLTDRVDAAALTALLREPAPLPTLAERLIQQANALGGHDNVSVLLARASAGT